MKVNYIQSYSPDFKISERLNEIIEPLDGWICLTDMDTLKPPGFAERLIKILKEASEDMVIGAMTNRLRKGNIAVVEELYDNPNITDHLQKSDDLWSEFETQLAEISVVAGNCMVFHKKVFNLVGGFPDKTMFDRAFCKKAMVYGAKLRLAKGLYIFHLYRWGKDPFDVSHLIK